MSATSIFNHVLGPVMRGPSSSHTAGAFHIGCLARSLFGERPRKAVFAFDPGGSYGKVFRQQGADLAFACGILGLPLTDDAFPNALAKAAEAGVAIAFEIRELEGADHPNTVEIELSSAGGRTLRLRANSIGGGAVEFTRLNDWPIHFTGEAHEIAIEVEPGAEPAIVPFLSSSRITRHASFLTARGREPFPKQTLQSLPGVRGVWMTEPVFFVQQGEPLFSSAAEMVALAAERGVSLGQLALDYEATLLGLSRSEVLDEMTRRFEVMRRSVAEGLKPRPPAMQLLAPSAGAIFEAEAKGKLAAGGLHARAAARALAAMHVNSGMGVVCAAPTGGSAGTLPGVVVTLVEDMGIGRREAVLALLAAGAVGVIVANRATFAAEVAGCQVEIGAAGAMAAAAVVDAVGGRPDQAADAAAIAFQNTMGSVCDLVQGIVEIPCHTRNAAAASNAFLCADLVLGGYSNPIPLDETIDAVYAVGRMLPDELRCTALGGLAATPSARAMKRRR